VRTHHAQGALAVFDGILWLGELRLGRDAGKQSACSKKKGDAKFHKGSSKNGYGKQRLTQGSKFP
jgi:hypothetical protein